MDLLAGYGDSDEEQEEVDDKKRKIDDNTQEETNNNNTPKKLKTIEENTTPNNKDKVKSKEDDDDELPPLPDMFTTEDYKDDTSQHQGRVRTFKHVVGNYATYVHIPVPVQLIEECREALMEQGKQECPDLVAQDDITRTFPLREFQIDPFLQRLSRLFKDVYKFSLNFEEYEYFTNDEKTRTFLSMRVNNGKHMLCSLIAQLDEILADFRLPTFYEDPRPHATVAWTLGDVTPSLAHIVGPLSSSPSLSVDFVVCKIGKWIYKYDLK